MTGRGEEPRDGEDPGVEPLPPQAAAVFGPALPRAIRYVGLLTTAGIERGLLGPREAGRIWSRHLLNSAALAALVPGRSIVVDVGSGAGLPGVPLALARPDLHMILLEPMARRVAFLHEVVSDLRLDIEVRRGRAEDVAPKSVDVVAARAVAPLARLASWTLPLLRPGGRLLALKGSTAAAEILEAGSALEAWPTARVTLVDAPAGPDHALGSATVVMIELDTSST